MSYLALILLLKEKYLLGDECELDTVLKCFMYIILRRRYSYPSFTWKEAKAHGGM